MSFTDVMERVQQGFEALGVAVLIVGIAWSAVVTVRTWRASGGRRAYQGLRATFGGALLLSIEILVAADLIRTVAISPTLQSVAVLGLIVLIRTLLSFSLQVEIERVPPWRRALTTGPELLARAARATRTHQTRIDHCVIAVSDWDRSTAFYRDVLGAEIVHHDAGRVAYRFGDQQLNVHGPGLDVGTLVARVPVAPGGSDLCFTWPGTVEEAVDHLRRHGVEIEDGPVSRLGGRDRGMSVYFRDPDGTLLELITYPRG